MARTNGPRTRSKSVRQSVTIPGSLATEVRRIAHEQRLTMSRALVALAEKGVQAEVEAKANLNAAYQRFMEERDPARKEEAGKARSAQFSGRTRLPAIRFADLPRAVWEHLLERVQARQISLADLSRRLTVLAPKILARMASIIEVAVGWCAGLAQSAP